MQSVTTGKEAKFSFREINDTTGLYFEKTAPIRLYNDEWHIIYHMNLTALQNEFQAIETTVSKLQNLCKHLHEQFNIPTDYIATETGRPIKSQHFSRQCGAFLHQIQVSMKQINDFNAHWFYTTTRAKRAHFNIVGSLLRSLFGTLAQEDAEDYLQRFNEMETQLLDRQVIAKEHTTLLQSTAEILKSFHSDNMDLHNKTELQFLSLHNLIFNLTNDFENLWFNLEFQSQIDDLVIFISLSLESYHNKQRQFLEAITFGSTSVAATPIILPPALFIDELTFVQTQISGTNLALPLPITKDFIATYYQMASTRSRIINDQLLVSMSIPLIDLTPYQLIKVTSLPSQLASDLYQFIIPEHEYIAVDEFHETFVSLTNKELENCHDLRGQSQDFTIICMQNSPTFHITPSRDDCSITLLTNSNTTKHCDTRVSTIKSEMYIKLRQPNTWIAVFPRPQILYIRCSNQPTFEEQVQGIGIISIKQDCQLKTNQILITAQNNYFSEVYQQITPPTTHDELFDEFPIHQTSQKFIQQIDAPNVISFGESDKLKRLSTSISKLKEQLHQTSYSEYRRINSTRPKISIYHVVWITITSTFTLLSVMTLLFAFQHYRNKYIYRPNDQEMGDTYVQGSTV